MPLSRRGLLGGTGGFAYLNRSSINPPTKEAQLPVGSHVVVVGAGFAGIGAAELLIERGYKVTHIEAGDRIGGRALSVNADGFPADLGANWLRPSKNNLLMPFARDQGLLSSKSNLVDGVVVSNGKADELDLGEAYGLLERPLVKSYLWYHFKKRIGLRPRAGSVETLAGKILRSAGTSGCAVKSLLKANYAVDLDDLSATVLLDEGSVSDDLNEPTIIGGMQALAAALITQTKPSFNETVAAISRTTKGVEVFTKKRTISADAVIVTVPVSVLKAGAIAFDPGLPPSHQAVLDAMGMGNLLKVWIRYPSANWIFNHTVASFCENSLFEAVFNFEKSHGAPILMGMAAGRNAHQLEELNDQEITKLFISDINKHIGLQLTTPSHVEISRWGKDPLVGGAYMYPNADYRDKDNHVLRRPIANRILLAGEALADSYGYVDTAWADGRRAAELIAVT